MAQINDGSGKSVSVELNLVPFIDLMSVCIIFLLITAVWTQISMIQLGTSVYGMQASEGDKRLAPTPHEDITFQVDVLPSGYRVFFNSKRWFIPKSKTGIYNHQKFTKLVKGFKNQYPKKVDVIISSKDSMLYRDLIQAMDLLIKAGFNGIAISTGNITI